MRRLRWLLFVALLAVALATLAARGSGGLAAPPLSFDGATQWAETRDSMVAVFALVRVGALAAGAYLFLVLLVSRAIAAFDERRGDAAFDRLTFGLARGLLAVVGLGVLSTPLAHAASAQTTSSSTAVVRELDPAPDTSEAVILPLTDQPPRPTDASLTDPVPPVAPTGEQYVVTAGDSLWGVAAARLSEATGRTDLTDAEIARYWTAVLDANPLPNPDLLFVGQAVELPAITP
jgi:hypothetical protein